MKSTILVLVLSAFSTSAYASTVECVVTSAHGGCGSVSTVESTISTDPSGKDAKHTQVLSVTGEDGDFFSTFYIIGQNLDGSPTGRTEKFNVFGQYNAEKIFLNAGLADHPESNLTVSTEGGTRAKLWVCGLPVQKNESYLRFSLSCSVKK